MDSEKPKHVPPRITREDFEVGRMKPASYAFEDIAAAVIDHVSRPRKEWTPRRLEAMKRYKYHGSWNLARPENDEDLRKFFDIFNDVYFNGVLAGHCKLEWYESTVGGNRGSALAVCEPYLPGNTVNENYVLDPRFKPEKPWAQIGMRKASNSLAIYNPTAKLEQYHNCLVHEMLHAVFVVYACNCKNGCSKKFDDVMVAHGGHDDSFLAAANAIEKAEKVKWRGGRFGLLGLHLDTYKDRGLLSKVVETGVPLPPDPELRRMGMDIESLLGKLPYYRNDYAKKYQRGQQQKQLMNANRCIRSYWTVDSDFETSKKFGVVCL
jgi:hypothetical protein